MRLAGAILGIALFWAGAALADVPAVGQPQAAAAPSPIPQSVWLLHADGSAEHLQSGWNCPARIDDYALGPLHIYDGFGLDVSCDLRTSRALLTLYVTHVPADFNLAVAYAAAKDGVIQGSPQRHPTPVSEDKVEASGFTWSRAVYAEDGGLHSALWMTMLRPDWYFEFRATYPAEQEAAVDATLAKLALMTAQSAGEHLNLCAKELQPIRAGIRVVDPKKLADQAMMTGLLSSAAQAAAQDKPEKVSGDPPMLWCAEAPSQQGKISLLLWRGIHPDGSDAKADRVTGMTMGPPPELDISVIPLAELVAEEAAKGAPAPERWTVETHQGAQTWIFGYFDGRPSGDMEASLFADILQGKAKPIGGYKTDGKNITLSVPPVPGP